MLCSRFQDSMFWTDFQTKINDDQLAIPEAIESLQEMVQDCIQDYFVNQDAPKTLNLLTNMDSGLQGLISSLGSSKLGENEKELLTQLHQQVTQTLRQIKETIEYESPDNDILLLSREKLRKTSTTTATERGSQNLTDTDSGSGRKTVKESLSLAQRESTRDTSDQEKKVKLGISFDSEEEDKFELLRVQVKEESEDSVSKIKERFFELFGKMKEDFEEQRIEEAYEMKQKLIGHVKANSEDEKLKQWFELYLGLNKGFMSEVELWNKEINTIVQQLNEEKGYSKYETRKYGNIRHKTQEDGKVVIKMETIAEASLINILTLMYEANGYNKWVPFCKESKLLKPLQKATFAYWLRYSLPTPFTDRECYCLGIGVDRIKKNGSILLISKSLDSGHEIIKKYGVQPNKKEKYMKLDAQMGTEIIPLGGDKVKIRVVTSFDAHVKYMSEPILKWGSKKIAKGIFKKLLGKAKNLKGTFWEKKKEENKEFYEWLGEKVKKANSLAG